MFNLKLMNDSLGQRRQRLWAGTVLIYTGILVVFV